MGKIRKARLDDAEELIELIKLADNRSEEVARKKVRKYIESDNGFFVIAVENSKVVAYLLFMITEEDKNASRFISVGDYSCICWIAVHPEFRKLHFGSKLLNEAGKQASGYDKRGIWLDCRKNVAKFYEKNGFIRTGNYLKETPLGEAKLCYVMVRRF